jgi:hypothetical protein
MVLGGGTWKILKKRGSLNQKSLGTPAVEYKVSISLISLE